MEEFRAAHQRMFGLGQLKSIGKLAKLCEGDEKDAEGGEHEPINAPISASRSNSSNAESIVPIPPPPPPGAKRLITFSAGQGEKGKSHGPEVLGKPGLVTSAVSSSGLASAGPVITNEHGETVKILRTSIPSKKGPAPSPPTKKGASNMTSNGEHCVAANDGGQPEMITNQSNQSHCDSHDQMLIGTVNAFSTQPISIKVNLQLPTN
jgi:hypothetical protein